MKPSITRILVPMDFSAQSDLALQYAMELSGRLGASLHLLHVVEQPLVPASWSAEIYVPDLAALEAGLIAEAERLLTINRTLAEGQHLKVETSVVTGPAATTIIGVADNVGADLIVMGTHGRTGLSHLFMGSVAERVVRLAPCPVLTVRDTVRKADRPAARTAQQVA